MQLSGDYTFAAPPERVYALMLDPDTLMACLPGCERLDVIGEDEYSATMTIGVAMIKGKYEGRVKISDRNEPNSFKMLIEGKGPQGQVSGEGLIEIVADGTGSHVTWSGDPQVRGMLARIGSRVIQPAAKMIVGQFFKCLEQAVNVETAQS
ncbi:MAG TPA: carbon monoxide dehydrogenase subunit G [Thermomicrobiales bacterium]|nr:carbon monoxide dehydrogenase subunit G [Thermomicrobiales bacterium]